MGQKALVIGSGGREHAMAWKMAQSPLVEEIVVAPGNPGMDETPKVRTANFKPSGESVTEFVKENNIDLVVIGPEAFLDQGLVDELEANGILAFGPSMKASQLESSKHFAKEFMKRWNIPTANFMAFDKKDEALTALKEWPVEEKGIVIKADALAGGKGVVVTHDRVEAEKTVVDFLENPECTVKTEWLLFEEMLSGKEISVFAVCDGEKMNVIGHACDYKRVSDGDIGPNTGGMGCFIPQTWPDKDLKEQIENEVILPVLKGMKEEGTPFKGILFAGLMVENNKANVIEFNVRMGDPETQVVLPSFSGDLFWEFKTAAQGKLDVKPWPTSQKTGLHVVMASGGYPSIDGTPLDTGHEITLPEELMDGNLNKGLVFFAGVKKQNKAYINSGGRVLGVTVLGDNVEEVREKAYQAISKINFNGTHWRKDIGLNR